MDNACFISTISALDLNTNDKLIPLHRYTKSQILADTYFDDIGWDIDQQNYYHTQLTPTMSSFLYNQIVNFNVNCSSGSNVNKNSITYNNQKDIIKSANTITLSNVSLTNNSSLTLIANNSITINSGFSVSTGCTFSANIAPVIAPKTSLAGNLPQFNPGTLRNQYMDIKGGKVNDVKFNGEGCAISIAAASMLTDEIKGKNLEEVEKLGVHDLIGLIGIDPGPARLKCATLSLKAIKKALFLYEHKTIDAATNELRLGPELLLLPNIDSTVILS